MKSPISPKYMNATLPQSPSTTPWATPPSSTLSVMRVGAACGVRRCEGRSSTPPWPRLLSPPSSTPWAPCSALCHGHRRRPTPPQAKHNPAPPPLTPNYQRPLPEVRAIVVEEKKVSQLAKVANGISKLVRDVIVIGEPGSEAAPLRDAGIEVHGFAALVDGASASDVAPHPPAPSHHACIMYTSGTTGTPKGVVHTQASMTAVIAGVVNLTRQGHIPVTHDDSTLSYLTLAHIFGRVVEEFALSRGASIGYWQGDVKALMDDLKELRPTLFIAVPRILERVADGVRKKVAAGPVLSRVLFNAAFTAKRLLLKTGLSHG